MLDQTEVALLAFAGGSLMAAAISAFVTHLIFHPVISVRLDDKRGSYGEVTAYHLDDRQKPTGVTEQVKYFRLRIENTGLSSIKDCSGYITKLTKRVGGQTTDSEEEVLTLGWAHYGAGPVRDIPRGAFFHMDIATLRLLPNGGSKLDIYRLPNNLAHLLSGGKATFTFEILVASDNASPRRKIPVEFTFDPASVDLKFDPIDRTRYPWWAWWRRLRH